MKKLATLIGLTITLCTTSVYADCTDGTEYQGANGLYICVSNVNLNWFSAWAWCDANNLRLARWDDLCPNITKGQKCTNVNSIPGDNSYGIKYKIADPHPTNAAKHGCLNRRGDGAYYYSDNDALTERFQTSYPLRVICVNK